MYLTFENPAYLWYLASLPLLVMTHFLSLRGAKRRAMQFANFQTLKRVAGRRFVTKNMTVLLMRIAILVMLIFSAAGIQLWHQAERLPSNYVIAIDISSSMAAKDFEPSRLEVAKDYATRFVDTLHAEAKVGVVTFSGVTIIKQVLTDDKNAVKIAIDSIEITKAGGTDIPGALITSTNLLLADPDLGKTIVLFTDGTSTLGNFIDNSMVRAVSYAQEHKVVIDCVGIGSESAPIGYLPEYYNITATYDPENLYMLSNATGGVVIPASDEDTLEESFEGLLESADEVFVSKRLDLGLLVVGILLLFIEWGLINSRYRRIT
ncbi:VWA domain-containing protein [Candidatus Woesearchaeota archaeon]|nr:VWA domain-containing protein [Candidatus Woesearchaeota archaeon]